MNEQPKTCLLMKWSTFWSSLDAKSSHAFTVAMGYAFDEPRLKRIARHADRCIVAGSTAPVAFAEALDLELLGLIDDSGVPIPDIAAPPAAPPKL